MSRTAFRQQRRGEHAQPEKGGDREHAQRLRQQERHAPHRLAQRGGGVPRADLAPHRAAGRARRRSTSRTPALHDKPLSRASRPSSPKPVELKDRHQQRRTPRRKQNQGRRPAAGNASTSVGTARWPPHCFSSKGLAHSIDRHGET
jgi:hypothetical protein